VTEIGDECEKCSVGYRMFRDCTQLKGHFGGACGSCKRPDRAYKCTIRDVDGNTKLDRDEEIEMVDRTENGTRPASKYSLRSRVNDQDANSKKYSA
jgi:hypothetical protein